MKFIFVAITIISSLSLSAGTGIVRQNIEVLSMNDTAKASSLSSLLNLYYGVKDALINSDAQRSLHNQTDWFSIEKGSTQSYGEAIKTHHFKTKLLNEWKRMTAIIS